MKRLILALITALLLFVGLATGFLGWPAYRQYKQGRGVSRAEASLARGDFAAASLSARQVLQINPRNIEACQLMARLAESSRSPAALDWYLRVVDAAPTIKNRLNLAACALRFERSPFPVASRTLAELEVSARDLAAFHALAAQLALKANHVENAAEHLRTAQRLEPANQLHRFNLAALDLQSAKLAGSAQRELETLSSDPHLGPLALRWLIADASRRKKLRRAVELSERVLALPAATIDDRLTYLTILQSLEQNDHRPSLSEQAAALQAKQPKFQEFLQSFQAQASSNSLQVYALCEWMGSHGLADSALRWSKALEDPAGKAQPVRMAIANLYLAKSDWLELEHCLSTDKWNELEFLRLAMLARAAWGQDRQSAGNAFWGRAVRAAGDQLGALVVLARLSQDWNRSSEEPLWQVVRRFPREGWARDELERRYLAEGNTHGLNLLQGSALSEGGAASDITNRNNFACTSLLLGINLPQAHAIARELYTAHSEDPVLASTFAYSLHLQKRTTEALAVLERFDRRTLESPNIALYYGALLAADGQSERSGPFLASAARAPMLPEEKLLLQRSRDR